MIDLDTLLVFGAAIPSLMGMVAMGVGGSLRERDDALWLWGVAMLLAGASGCRWRARSFSSDWP